jgi:hypothetical protein
MVTDVCRTSWRSAASKRGSGATELIVRLQRLVGRRRGRAMVCTRARCAILSGRSSPEDGATRCVPVCLLSHRRRRIVLSGTRERLDSIAVAVNEPPDQFDSHSADVWIRVLLEQADAWTEDGGLTGPTDVRLATVTGQRMYGIDSHADVDVLQHGEHVLESILYEELIEQSATLLSYAGVGMP